jgi:uncharacterized membrane protein
MLSSDLSARALGWFSLGLGTAQLLAPGTVARGIGVGRGGLSRTILRLLGARELMAGVGLLTQRRPTVWLWSRVAGDLMDLGLLGAALGRNPRRPERLALAFGAASGITAADLAAAQMASAPQPMQLTKAITIGRPADEVYRFWRDFTHLPSFMSHLESVAVLDARRSHWTARGPAGRLVEWDAEITDDQPAARIAWRSLPGAVVEHSGSVRFVPAPGNRGTEVRVEITYDLPGGSLGSTVARLFGQEPQQQVQADLRKVKQVLETGEVVRSAATLEGTQLLQSPARPRPAAQGVRA